MMKSKKNLARKILCGLLAAGVVGVAGSAMAAVPKGTTAPATYGSYNKNDQINVNDTFPNGIIDNGVDVGIYAEGGKSTFTNKNISITANKNSIKTSLYDQVYKKDENGNYILDKNGKKIPVLDNQGNKVYEYNGKDTYWDQKGLEANKGEISVAAEDSVNIKAENNNGNAYAIHSYNSGAKIEILGKNISLEAKASGTAAANTIGSKGKISIGNADTEKISFSAESSKAISYGIYTIANEGNIDLNAKVIDISSVSNGTDAYAIKNSSGSVNNSRISLGNLNNTKLNMSAVSNNGKAYVLYADKKSITEINASDVEFNAKAVNRVVGIEAANGSTIVNINAKNDVNIIAESDLDVANGISDSYAKTTINANAINVTAKTNAQEKMAYALTSSNNGDVILDAKKIKLEAEGDGAVAINAPKNTNFKVGADNSTIDIIANSKIAARGVSVTDNSTVVLGGENATVNVSAKGDNADGLANVTGKELTINGKELNVSATTAGILAQNNTTPGSTDNFATVNINTAKTVINAKTGIAAYSQGVVNMNDGDVEINAEKAIETRGYATTNINQDGSHTVKINGDINFNVTDDGKSGTIADANVNINLSNADSYLTGSVNKTVPEGLSEDVNGMNIDISNKAAWNMTGDSFVNTATVSDGGSINLQAGVNDFAAGDITLNKGNLSLQGDEQEVAIQNLNGTGGTINTDSVNNIVFVNDKAGNTKVNVNGTSKVTDQIASGNATLQDLANVVTNMEEEKETSLADTVTSEANDIIGGYSADVKDGKIVAGSEKTYENTTNRAISDMASISLMTWRQENNDMNKRLGELRDSKGEHGAWARMARGESKYGAQNVKNQYNYYQVGYDEKLSVNPNWTVGVALTRTEGNSTFAAGSGENKHTGVAVYGSYLNDNGSFIDLIAKYARMDNDYKTIGAGVGNADYETNGYSLSAEYGKRFTKDSGFWIEPQVELTYGKVSSANYLTSKGAKVYQEGMDSLVARLGFSLGKNIKQGNIYARASYLYDFDGETKATMTGAGSASFEQDLGGGWWEVGVGTNLNLSDATHLYFDVEKTYGGNVATPWQWNAGVRWSF